MTSLFTPSTTYHSLETGSPLSSPTRAELIEYCYTLSYQQLIQSIDTRLALIDRCIIISNRILDNITNHNTTHTNKQPYNELYTSLQSSVMNSNSTINETSIMIGELYGIGKNDSIEHRLLTQAIDKYKLQLKSYQSTVFQIEQQYNKFQSTINKYNNSRSTLTDIPSTHNDINQRHESRSNSNSSNHNNQQELLPNPNQFNIVNEYTVQEQIELDSELQARQQFILDIERDVMIVQQMFIDLNDMVYQQQSSIDSIERSIYETANKAHDGMQQLYIAEKYQRSKRHKMCCMVLMMTLIIVTVVMVVSIILHG